MGRQAGQTQQSSNYVHDTSKALYILYFPWFFTFKPINVFDTIVLLKKQNKHKNSTSSSSIRLLRVDREH